VSAVVTVTECDPDGTWLVSLHGDHDLATRAQLARETNAIWPVCKAAVIDLSDVVFIDSGVIRWLLDVERRLEAAGGFTLSVVEGTPGSPAARIFQLLRVRHVLACYPTREQAFAQAPVGAGTFSLPQTRPEPSRGDAGGREAA
jgi:anti-anti-sigma regulatory factor